MNSMLKKKEVKNIKKRIQFLFAFSLKLKLPICSTWILQRVVKWEHDFALWIPAVMKNTCRYSIYVWTVDTLWGGELLYTRNNVGLSRKQNLKAIFKYLHALSAIYVIGFCVRFQFLEQLYLHIR